LKGELTGLVASLSRPGVLSPDAVTSGVALREVSFAAFRAGRADTSNDCLAAFADRP
jgi:hypothetical protein